MMDGRAGHGEMLVRAGVCGEFLDGDHLVAARGRYHRRRGVGRAMSSPGTIARTGSGSRTLGIGRRCLAAVTGGAAAGLHAEPAGGVDGTQPAGRLLSRSGDHPTGSGCPQAGQPGAVTETSLDGVGVLNSTANRTRPARRRRNCRHRQS